MDLLHQEQPVPEEPVRGEQRYFWWVVGEAKGPKHPAMGENAPQPKHPSPDRELPEGGEDEAVTTALSSTGGDSSETGL